MNTELKMTCETIISNRNILEGILTWEDGRIHTVCASLYELANKTVDTRGVEYCKKQIKKRVSAFSEIRGLALSIISCMIDIRGGEDVHIEQMISAYKSLRKEFRASSLLALGAEILAENVDEDRFDEIACRAKRIYKNMQSKHPFVTGEDDYLMSVLLAQSDRDVETLCDEIERCFRYLKDNRVVSASNSLQAISCTLSLYDGAVNVKCQKMIDLYNRIKDRKYKYDKYYGLPMLAVLSQLDRPVESIVDDIREVNDWLKNIKGFGFFMGESSRMMYAAMMVSQCYSDDKNAGSSVAGGVISAMIAEELAMVACIAASSSAAAANN